MKKNPFKNWGIIFSLRQAEEKKAKKDTENWRH